ERNRNEQEQHYCGGDDALRCARHRALTSRVIAADEAFAITSGAGQRPDDREVRLQTAHARERHKRPNTARPTTSAGTKVTTRFRSGVDHDPAPAVTKAAIRAVAIATRGNFGCERSPCLALFMTCPFASKHTTAVTRRVLLNARLGHTV